MAAQALLNRPGSQTHAEADRVWLKPANAGGESFWPDPFYLAQGAPPLQQQQRFQTMNPNQFQTMSPNQFQAMSPNQVPGMNPNQFQTMTPNQFQALNPDQQQAFGNQGQRLDSYGSLPPSAGILLPSASNENLDSGLRSRLPGTGFGLCGIGGRPERPTLPAKAVGANAFPGEGGQYGPDGLPLGETDDAVKRQRYMFSDKKISQWLGIGFSDLMLPWLLFTLILLPVGLAYFTLSLLCWLSLFTALYLCCWFFMCSRGTPWRLLAVFCFAATFLGLICGMYSKLRYLSYSYAYGELPYFVNLSPTMNSGAYNDAGVVQFSSGAFVDNSRSIGLKNGNTFCVAPIVTDEVIDSPYPRYWWAVGENCCGERGSFKCGGTSGVTGGLALLPGGPFYTQEYTDAVTMAATLFSVTVPTQPMLVLWTGDLQPTQQLLLRSAMLFCVAAALLFLLIPCCLVACMYVTKTSLMGDAPGKTAVEWEWHENNAAQMVIAYAPKDSAVVSDENSDANHDQVELRRDLVEQRCYWSGQVIHDYIFHLCNSHLFLSPALCHPLHPFDKFERLFVLIMVALLLIFPIAAVEASRILKVESKILELVLIALLVTVPRNILKHFMQKKCTDEEAAALFALPGDATKTPAKKSTVQSLAFFIGVFAIVAIICMICIAIIIRSGHSVFVQLWLACSGLAYAFVLNLLFDAIQPGVGDSHCWDLSGKLYFGFFGRWRLERLSYLKDPQGFLWRAERQQQLGF